MSAPLPACTFRSRLLAPLALALAAATSAPAHPDPAPAATSAPAPATLQVLQTYSLGQPLGQLRAVPVRLGPDQPPALLVAFSADFDVDPYPEMFFLPKDTLKLALLTLDGRELWRRDLGPGLIPGMWFVPLLPADLDGDGRDEIYFVDNKNPQHPLTRSGRVLRRLDAATGEPAGDAPWPRHLESQWLNYGFRFFLLAGRVAGRDVLVSAQGTYGDMFLQGWNADLTQRWKVEIPADTKGARGSHMCPVVDWDGDGDDEFLWGERLLRVRDGSEIFCADRVVYDGHSDVVAPLLGADSRTWSVFTARESTEYNHNFPHLVRPPISPRVVMFDSAGKRLWSALDAGHMDMGWLARVGPERRPVAAAVRIGRKTSGPDGRRHTAIEEFYWDALTGEELKFPVPAYRTTPVDLDGDARHEFVRGGDGALFAADGRSLGAVDGSVALVSKVDAARPGEQLLVYRPDGTVQLWGRIDGTDTPEALARYAHPYYRANQRLTASGANLVNLGGL
jgi:hypothetical protein